MGKIEEVELETSPIRVGVIGANPDQSWASKSHLPALQALPEFDLVGVSTTSAETAKASAERFGARLAFDNARALIEHPDIDLVTVAVKAPLHHDLAVAAARAGKHVYCEWPMGATLEQSEAMAAAVRASGVRGVTGLQGRASPWVNAIRDIVQSGKLGRILSTSVIASGAMMGAVVAPRSVYTLDRHNGATMLNISFGHLLDSVLYCLGEPSEISSLLATQRPEVRVGETDQMAPMTASDQIVVAGRLSSGAITSFHMRGGMSRATNLIWEINGTEGDLVVTAAMPFVHFGPLKIEYATGGHALTELDVTASLPAIPQELAGTPAFNPACLYRAFAEDLRNGTTISPSFDDGLARRRLLDLIHRSDRNAARSKVSA